MYNHHALISNNLGGESRPLINHMSSEEVLEITAKIIASAHHLRETADKMLINHKKYLEDQSVIAWETEDQETTRVAIKTCYDKTNNALNTI